MSPASPPVHFRAQVRPEDADAVEQLVRATGVFSEHEIAIARELVEENLAKGEDASGYRFNFADGAHGLDGYTCFGAIPGTDRRYELYWIAVNPKTRRAKLGQKLIAAAEAQVREAGGVYLFAETSSSANYEAARKFYLAHGYHLMGSIANWYSDGDGLQTYGKRLAGQAQGG